MRNKFLLSAVLLLLMFVACEQKPANTKPGDKTTTATTSAADIEPTIQVPAYKGLVNDYDSLFTEEQERELDSILRDYEKQTTAEIVIATIDSSMAKPANFDYFIALMADQWGVGKEDKKNGSLIAISYDWGIIRIHHGYDIQKVLPEDESQLIIYNVFLPKFMEEKIYEGTRTGTLTLINKLKERLK